MIRLPFAKIELATGMEHSALANVYFDKEGGNLVASDGFILVVIPVEFEEEDVSGVIVPEALLAARENQGNLRLCRHETVVGEESYDRSDDYPDVNVVVAKVLEEESESTVVSLDAHRLLNLARALLDDPKYDVYGVTLEIRSKNEPILVRPYVRGGGLYHDKRFGILMPMVMEEGG